MIVRNEVHIVHEVLDLVAPYIAYWVIVDTGSDDGTQDAIRARMDSLGVPGELHERPWRNFGHNRSEALDLAAGHADYIWVIDADDRLDGTPDFSALSSDSYELRYRQNGVTFWMPYLIRDGLPWRFHGVVHEFLTCDRPTQGARLEGDYFIESRRLGGRNLDPQKYARDRDLLLAEVLRDPGDTRSMFYLANTYRDLGDSENARICYQRRSEMGGWDEEVYCSLYQMGEAMLRLGSPWPETQDVLLRAWEFRPHRGEALTAIGRYYRTADRFQLGHLFAQRAAAIPFPADERLFAYDHVSSALDDQAICASRLGLHPEAFAVCRQLLAREDLSDQNRVRIAGNREFSVPAMLDLAQVYPEGLVRSMRSAPQDADVEVSVSLTTGADLDIAERSMNSLLNSCTDCPRIGRFVVDDSLLSAEDRAVFRSRYPFAEPLGLSADSVGDRLHRISDTITSRYWFHVEPGWRFFAPEDLITRLIAVLEAEPHVLQLAVNYEDAPALTGRNAPESDVCRSPATGRYVLTDALAAGPALIDTERLARIGGIGGPNAEIHADLTGRARAAGMGMASLDEVLCVKSQ